MNEALVADCEQTLAARAKSFRFAAWLLPAQTRQDAAVLYAFCRLVDDIADDSPSPEAARHGLAALEDELLGLAPARPLVAAARARMAKIVPAIDLIQGAMDDQNRAIIADDGALIRYCYAVAGTVGLMMCRVLQVQDERAWPHAVDLGIAMQLTNICRDVAEDARLRRVYLPQTRLHAQGETPARLLAGAADPARVARVVAELLDLADRYYASADKGMAAISWRARLAILVASRVYAGIGARLRARGCDALSGRVSVPLWRKILYVPDAMRAFVRLSVAAPAAHDGRLHLALTQEAMER